MKKKLLSFLLGLLVLVLIVEVLVRVSGYAFLKNQETRNHKINISKQNIKTIKIVFFGESATAVAANESNTLLVQENAYPFLVEKYLNEMQNKYNFVVVNKGMMAGNTSKILSELKRYLREDDPKIAVFMMGMKDRHGKEIINNLSYIVDKLDEYMSFFKTYNLVSFYLEQFRDRKSNIDDSKKVEKFEDLNKSFVSSYYRKVYANLGNEIVDSKLTKNEIDWVIKQMMLASYFGNSGLFDKSKKIFSESIQKYSLGSFLLADDLVRANKSNEGIIVLNEFVKKYPLNPYGYKELAEIFIINGDIKTANAVLDKALKLNLKNSLPLKIAKAKIDLENKKMIDGISSLENECGINNPVKIKLEKSMTKQEWLMGFGKKIQFEECIYTLSELYYYSAKYDLAEKNLLLLLNKGKNVSSGVNLLNKVYEKTGQKKKIESVIKDVASDSRRLGDVFALADYYAYSKQWNDLDELLENTQKDFFKTRNNFDEIYELLLKKNIKTVFMQYPTFSVEFLKLFSGSKKEVYYLDNENVFNGEHKSEFFFEPRYPYNFNHYSKKGAMVLAKHIADNIYKKIEEGVL